MGAYAEYVCMPEDGSLAMKPATMTHDEAAAVPYGAIMATGLLRRATVQPGQKVLINGASGGIGSAAVQLAKHYGAEVTGVCGAPRLEYVKALGADRVIDYTREDFTQNGETYDLIFDVLGKSSFATCKNSLKPDGVYLLASFKTKPWLQMLRTKLAGSLPGRQTGQKVVCAFADEKPADLEFVGKLAELGACKYRHRPLLSVWSRPPRPTATSSQGQEQGRSSYSSNTANPASALLSWISHRVILRPRIPRGGIGKFRNSLCHAEVRRSIPFASKPGCLADSA